MTPTRTRSRSLAGRPPRRCPGAVLTSDDFQTGVNVTECRLAPAGHARHRHAAEQSRFRRRLLQPGDRVDVLMSMEDLDGSTRWSCPIRMPRRWPGGQPDPYISLDRYVNNTTVKVVVQNVQVLAAIAAPTDESEQSATPRLRPSRTWSCCSAVTPQQAEVVRFAQLDGNISLVAARAGRLPAPPRCDTTASPEAAGRPVRRPAAGTGHPDQPLIIERGRR